MTRGAVDIALVGVPWDGGNTNRAGARHGLREIRNMSSLMRRTHHMLGICPYELCRVADCGDASVNPVDLNDTIGRIERFFAELHGAGAEPLRADARAPLNAGEGGTGCHAPKRAGRPAAEQGRSLGHPAAPQTHRHPGRLPRERGAGHWRLPVQPFGREGGGAECPLPRGAHAQRAPGKREVPGAGSGHRRFQQAQPQPAGAGGAIAALDRAERGSPCSGLPLRLRPRHEAAQPYPGRRAVRRVGEGSNARHQCTGGVAVKHPKPPAETPAADTQSNLSDPDSRLMRKSKHHEYRQAYNAQAVVDAGGSQLIVSARISQCASDRNDLVADIEAIPALLGRPETVLADNGYANGAEVAALEADGIEALVSTSAEGRRRTHDFRPVKALPAAKEPKADWLKAMAEKLASEEGRALYKRRRQTVEPVFGIIKAVLGFAGFSLRGLDKVEGEWTLVALAYNCKRLHKLSLAT